MMTKKNFDELRVNKIIHRVPVKDTDFKSHLYLFEHNICILGKNKSTFQNNACRVTSIAIPLKP